MILTSLILASLAHASSRLDWPVSVLDMPRATANLFRATLEANQLSPATTTLEVVVKMPRYTWRRRDLGLERNARHLMNIEAALATHHLFVDMAMEQREFYRRDPENIVFRPLGLPPDLARDLRRRGIFINQQLLDAVDRNEPERLLFTGVETRWHEYLLAYYRDLDDLVRALRPIDGTLLDFEFRTLNKIRAMPTELYLSPRTHRALRARADVATFGALMEMTADELRATEGVTRSMIEEIRANFRGHGIALRGEEFQAFGMSARLNEKLAARGIRTARALASLVEPWPRVEAERAAVLWKIHESRDLDLNGGDLREILSAVAQAKDQQRHRVIACRASLGI